MMRRGQALIVGGGVLLALGVIAGAVAFRSQPIPAVDTTIAQVYVASTGEICDLRFTVVVNDHRESSSFVARRYLKTTELKTRSLIGTASATVNSAGNGTTFAALPGTPSTAEDEIAVVLTILREGARNAVRESGSPNAGVFLSETHQCRLPPPQEGTGHPAATADPIAGRQFGNWSVTPPDFEGFRVTASGEVCEVQVTVFFATSDPAVLARARAYLAGLDIATIDVSAYLADQVAYPAASRYFSRAHLEGLLVGDSVSAILSNYLAAQGIPGVVNAAESEVRCDND